MGSISETRGEGATEGRCMRRGEGATEGRCLRREGRVPRKADV